MKLLIVAATYHEIAPFMEHFNLSEREFSQKPAFDVLITGVGMTATAFSLGQFLHHHYKQILNVGIAGSFNSGIAIGSIVNVVEDTFAELGAQNKESFLPIEDLGFGKSAYLGNKISGLKHVKGITVNSVHGNEESIRNIKNRLNPEVESMEGASVFFCAEKFKTPAIQVRSISNYVEPRNTLNWNIQLAITNLNSWLIDYLEKLRQ